MARKLFNEKFKHEIYKYISQLKQRLKEIKEFLF